LREAPVSYKAILGHGNEGLKVYKNSLVRPDLKIL
jgi:hypothetical protein